MKTILVITALFIFDSLANCQTSDINIIDSASYKVNLRFIDENYAMFIIDWYDSKEYQLLKYSESNDTVTLISSDDDVEISVDVFYYYNENVGDGLVMLQTEFKHLYIEGNGLREGFKYETPFASSTPQDSTDYLFTDVMPLNEMQFPLTIHSKNFEDLILEINLPPKMNFIKVRVTYLFSSFHLMTDMEIPFPMTRAIDGHSKVLTFRYNKSL